MKKLIISVILALATMSTMASAANISVSNHGWYSSNITITGSDDVKHTMKQVLLGGVFQATVPNEGTWEVSTVINGILSSQVLKAEGTGPAAFELHGTFFNASLRKMI